MASAAEQLAANLNFGALAKSEDLKSRIWFTLGALIVYRLGTYIPVPGIDAVELARFAAQNSSGILGWVNGLAGGALGRLAIFAPPRVDSSDLVIGLGSGDYLEGHLERVRSSSTPMVIWKHCWRAPRRSNKTSAAKT